MKQLTLALCDRTANGFETVASQQFVQIGMIEKTQPFCGIVACGRETDQPAGRAMSADRG
jgi:hypothetical protein